MSWLVRRDAGRHQEETRTFGHDSGVGVDARGNGNRQAKHTRDQAKRRRAKAKDRREEWDQEPAAAVKHCRLEGHPCEANQTCYAPFVCVVSSPGNA